MDRPYSAVGQDRQKLRIGLLSAWASRLGGGVFEAVLTHARILTSLGHEPRVFALADDRSDADRGRFGDLPVTTCRVVGPTRIGYAPDLTRALIDADLDMLHLHGIWMYPSHAGARWAARTGRPYLISPHGMLDPWITARSPWKKRLALYGYERRSWARATLFHALTEREREDIAMQAGDRPVAVIPNALTDPPPPSRGDRRRPVLLALSRIHPKKNFDALAAAWVRTEIARGGGRLVIAGWGEPEHVAAFETALASHACDSIDFVGPAFGERKAQLFADARFFILPSHSEGLPMAVLEAFSAGVPAILSAGCNLPGALDAGAALETGTDMPEIAAAIDRAFALDEDAYRAMADAARTLIETQFSAAAVTAQWQRQVDALTAPRR